MTKTSIKEIAQLPEAQPIIRRVGEALGDINAEGISRSEVACAVAAAVLIRRSTR